MIAKKAGGKKRPRLTKAQLLKREKAIIADIKAGALSYRQIAAKHKVSLPTVNNKARKAGISRGRRKGAKLFVAAPKRKVAKKATKKATKKAVRKTAKKATRKATKKAGRKVARKKATRKVARKKVARKAVRKTARRRAR
jgi:hypothetical protein